MTALKKYARLESGGLWRADAEAQRRDVVVSFGAATVVISDTAGRPLTHWSLPAVTRLNPGTRPALFAPDADTDTHETLEIDDALMIDAIEKVRKALARARPRRGKLRGLGTAAVFAVLAALGVWWLPGALREQAQNVMPDSKRIEIGATLLAHVQDLTGPVCRGQLGLEALGRFQARLFGPDGKGRIVVLPLGQQTALPLPGGIVALDSTLVERVDDPAVVAGFVLAAARAASLRDPMLPIIERAGFGNTLRLLATGELPPHVLESYAANLIGDRSFETMPEAQLLPIFEEANVSSAPYGRFLQETGQPVMELIVADPLKDFSPAEVLSDRDWVSLQGICAGS